MADHIRSGVQILIGMDGGDYFSLLEEIRKTRKTEWTCHENTQVGDIVFFYFGEKIGELVACGKVLKSRWEVEGWTSPSWRYRTKVGDLQRVHGITRDLIRNQIPEFTWINQPRMHRPLTQEEATKLTKLVQVGQEIPVEQLAEELVGLEGEEKQKMVIHRHRESRLRAAKIAKAKFLNNGILKCEVPGCGFDFAEVYGSVGVDYVQVHHLLPLSLGDGERETTMLDLAIVCANCHAMIHRGGECRSLESLIVKPRIPKTNFNKDQLKNRI